VVGVVVFDFVMWGLVLWVLVWLSCCFFFDCVLILVALVWLWFGFGGDGVW